MRSSVLFAALVLSVAGCKKEEKHPRDQPQATAPPAAPAQPVAEADEGPLPWIHDDYPAALARAKAEKKPLVVDLWAAWCHTCLSMQQTVLRDPSLAELADRFVWASIDTEKPSNAPVLANLPVEVWPTFYVVSPADGFIQARQLGATGISGFRDFLLQGETSHLQARGAAGELTDDEVLQELRTADQAAADGDYATAARHYGKALAAAPADWNRQSEVLVLQISSLARAGSARACTELGSSRLADAARNESAAAADFVYWTHACADQVPSFDLAAFRARATETLEAILADDSAPLSVDDRAEALRVMRELAVDVGDEAAARALAERQVALLDRAVDEAGSAFVAWTHISHLVDTYLYLGRGAELLPLLERLTRELPNEYDPPYRLAIVLTKIGRHDEAARVAELAAERAPDGPRKTRILTVLANIHAERGDVAAEREVRRAVVEALAALPASQKRPEAEAEARAALRAASKKK